MMQRIEGRNRTATEFVEFQCGKNKPRFVAQIGSGGLWFVFRIDPAGRNGYGVRTLNAYQQKAFAVRRAEREAKKVA